MQEPPRSFPPETNPLAQTPPSMTNGEPTAFPPFGMLKLAAYLFAYPRLAILNSRHHKTWGKCLIIIFIVTAVVAVATSIQLTPKVRKQGDIICKLLIDSVESITYDTEKDSFGWTKQVKTPQLKADGDWQVCVVDKLQDFDSQQAKESGLKGGIILAHDNIGFWMLDSYSSSVTMVASVHRGSLINIFRQNGKVKDGRLILTGETLEDINRLLPPLTGSLMGIATAIFNLKLLLTCVAIFVIMSMIFNRVEKAPLGAVVASSLACTIPPYSLALISTLIPQLPVDMDTAFTVFFVIYLIVIFLDRSVIIKRIA